MSNLFAPEQPIIDRITQLVPDLQAVLSFSQLEAFETVPPVPAVVVGDIDFSSDDDPQDGSLQMIVQPWQIRLIVPHRQTDATVAETTNSVAGTLGFQILQALIGWRPVSGFLPMAFRDSASGEDKDHGYYIIDLYFETGLIVTGSGN